KRPAARTICDREGQTTLVRVDPGDAPSLECLGPPNSVLRNRQIINVAEYQAVPAIEVANRAVQRRIQVSEVGEVGPQLAGLGSVELVRSLRSAHIVD